MLDITTLAAWGEFLGGIAVVVSLIYLAFQIRQNSKLLRASTASATAQIQFGQNVLVIQDRDVARIFSNGLADPDSLPEADQQRFRAMIGLQLQGMAQSFEFHFDGIGSRASHAWVERGMRWFVPKPGFLQWWDDYRESHTPEFRDYVDGLIREGEAAG